MKQKDAGFSLVEILVSIVVLACIVIPICTSLVMCVRMDAKADAMLKAQLAVSSEVEKLMASGIDENNLPDPEDEHIAIAVTAGPEGAPYYNVTVSYDDDPETEGEPLVSVSTIIRKGGGDE